MCFNSLCLKQCRALCISMCIRWLSLSAGVDWHSIKWDGKQKCVRRLLQISLHARWSELKTQPWSYKRSVQNLLGQTCPERLSCKKKIHMLFVPAGYYHRCVVVCKLNTGSKYGVHWLLWRLLSSANFYIPPDSSHKNYPDDSYVSVFWAYRAFALAAFCGRASWLCTHE